MCSVSAVMDYGQRQWPSLLDPHWTRQTPIQPFMTSAIERDAILKFVELVEKAKEFDKAADQPHCEDPEKITLLEKIAARLEAIEKKLGIEAA